MILGQILKFIFRRFSGLCPENKQEHVVFSPPVKEKIKNSSIEARNDFFENRDFSVEFFGFSLMKTKQTCVDHNSAI